MRFGKDEKVKEKSTSRRTTETLGDTMLE